MKLLLIGQAPNRVGDPSKPLEGRIAVLLSRLAGVPAEEYLDKTERINLLCLWPGSAPHGKGDAFPRTLAEISARSLQPALRGRKIIFVGKAVAKTFHVKDTPYCTWQVHHGLDYSYAILPHPSGIVRWWNSKKNRKNASAFLSQALRNRR